MEQLSVYSELYKNELLDSIVPFWQKNSPDRLNGGYFTCLDTYGNVYDTDKFVWLQGRQIWCFSMLYNKVEKKQEWLDMALLGADFLEKYGRDQNGHFYFSLTKEGLPLVQPYNIFSDCFAVMAFSELYKITGLQKHKDIAIQTFSAINARKNNWKGKYEKTISGTRPMKNFALPMILVNLSYEMEHLLGNDFIASTVPSLLSELLEEFYKPEFGLILENISPDGKFVDSFEGRLLNPGHAIEAMWFVMDIGKRLGNQELIEKATKIMLHTLDYGWDKKYGGIYYFMDVKGKPLQQLEADQKLWWVHVEALVALAKGYAYTGNLACLNAFNQVHDYTWNHFRDVENGEWFGYLNREGKVLQQMKGGKWKGCFHIPRALFQIWQTFSMIQNEYKAINPLETNVT